MSYFMAAGNLETAKNITTPLALAALCLLIGAGLLRTLVKDRSNKNNRLVIQWGFILALVLSICANVSFLVIAGYRREIRISGTVRDEAGGGLPRAIVDVAGKGRGITDDYGAFEFNIPDARAENDYEAIFTLKGYRPKTLKLPGRQPRSVDVTLSALSIDAASVISVRGAVSVRHALGNPLVTVPLSFVNPLGHEIMVSEIELRITAPDGTELRLAPQLIQFVAEGPPVAPLGSIAVGAGSSFDVFWTFGDTWGAEMGGIAAKANQQFMLTQQFQAPDPSKTVYNAELVHELQSFMESHFVWKPGTWTSAISCTAEGRHLRRVFSFVLSAQQVKSMRAIEAFYNSGIGVVSAWMYVPVGAANPTTVVEWMAQ
jgi:hypothetical protein